ncbi:hypothetical protein N7453_010503 [Penicillium expansum]|nr:hypothetical protein N7453_010503 [Penicillium expansum]
MFFRQTLDLDTAKSTVYYQGTESVIRAAIAQLPSAMGMGLSCGSSSPKRSDMRLCSYDGAGVLPHTTIDSVSSSWVSFNCTRDQNYSHATFEIHGTDTEVCGIRFFEKPISNFRVYGARNRDYRFGEQPDEGLNRIELYRRDRTKPWTVDIEWEKDDDDSLTSKLRGQVYCYWDDLNHPRSIPAYQEALQYAPDWVGVTKLGKGVLEVFQNFTL